MHALIIEPHPDVASAMQRHLEQNKWNISVCSNGEDGIETAQILKDEIDLITLEINVPDMNGLEAIQTLRAKAIKTPIMVISGSHDLSSKVTALGYGADDFVTKPFHMDEVMARITAITRRSKGHADNKIVIGNVQINLDAQSVAIRTENDGPWYPVHLTKKEYQMLELLTLRQGSPVTKDHFLRHLYNGVDEPCGKIIDVFINRIRKKLAYAHGGHRISTRWGGGYVFEPPMKQPALQMKSSSAPQFPVNGSPSFEERHAG